MFHTIDKTPLLWRGGVGRGIGRMCFLYNAMTSNAVLGNAMHWNVMYTRKRPMASKYHWVNSFALKWRIGVGRAIERMCFPHNALTSKAMWFKEESIDINLPLNSFELKSKSRSWERGIERMCAHSWRETSLQAQEVLLLPNQTQVNCAWVNITSLQTTS